jgi:hypothetical protein
VPWPPRTHDGLFILFPLSGETQSVNWVCMRGSLRMGSIAGSATVLLVGLFAPPPARTQPAPMQLLTDTPHYCAELFAEVEATQNALLEPAPPVVDRLALEGRQLCSLGEVRGGVIRLRRAMVLLHERAGEH